MSYFSNSEEIPNEVNEVVMKILDYSMDDDREFINVEDGQETLFALLIAHAAIFITMV